MNKIFKVADLRALETQVTKGKISYSRMVEILNEMAEASHAIDREWLREEFKNKVGPNPILDFDKIFDWFIPHLKDTEWIHPTKQLPANNQKILFMVSETEMRKGVFLFKDHFNRENIFCDGSFFVIGNIWAWMPLPTPPIHPEANSVLLQG